MDIQEIKDFIEEKTDEDVMVFDDYETAFLGITLDDRAVYDYEEMVKYLMEKDGIDMSEAIEWIDFNTIRACDYIENPPIIIQRFFPL